MTNEVMKLFGFECGYRFQYVSRQVKQLTPGMTFLEIAQTMWPGQWDKWDSESPSKFWTSQFKDGEHEVILEIIKDSSFRAGYVAGLTKLFKETQEAELKQATETILSQRCRTIGFKELCTIMAERGSDGVKEPSPAAQLLRRLSDLEKNEPSPVENSAREVYDRAKKGDTRAQEQVYDRILR